MVSGLCQTVLVLTVLGGAHTKARERLGQIEELGSPSWSFITSYLEYEEPAYNEQKGFTKDDFTDVLEGYQTRASHAKSFGWETAGEGEMPFAALLVGVDTNKYCMSTVVTLKAVVTPCGCVRTLGFIDAGHPDFEVKKSDQRRALYYQYDIGADIEVVAHNVEFVPDTVGSSFYPGVDKVITDQCFNVWLKAKVAEQVYAEEANQHAQMFFPAILHLSNSLLFDTPVRWPPYIILYRNESTYTNDGERYNYFYTADHSENPPAAVISSYNFLPLEDSDLTSNNDGNGWVQTKYRLVNVNVELCSQRLCSNSTSYEIVNHWMYYDLRLETMYCWCDMPWIDSDQIYMQVNNEQSPVYFKSVYRGFVGAPIIHRGSWVGWTTERVSRKASRNRERATWSQGLSKVLIEFLESKLPELKSAYRPHISDVNRRGFAIHDFKRLLPDPDLQESDLDLVAWAQIGAPRFEAEKRRRQDLSGATAASPGHTLILSGIFFLIFKMQYCQLVL